MNGMLPTNANCSDYHILSYYYLYSMDHVHTMPTPHEYVKGREMMMK